MIGVLTEAETAAFIADHPGLAVSLGGLVARVVWSAADELTADAVAALVAERLLPGGEAA